MGGLTQALGGQARANYAEQAGLENSIRGAGQGLGRAAGGGIDYDIARKKQGGGGTNPQPGAVGPWAPQYLDTKVGYYGGYA